MEGGEQPTSVQLQTQLLPGPTCPMPGAQLSQVQAPAALPGVPPTGAVLALGGQGPAAHTALAAHSTRCWTLPPSILLCCECQE